MLLSCDSNTPDENNATLQYPTITIAGYVIPQLSTPEKQFTYVNSLHSNEEEKKAALQAIARLFPGEKSYIGLAAIDLAYLELGRDYRLANRQQCLLARNQLQAIATDFSDIPDVQAKALWYLGWISIELLEKKEAGLGYYRKAAADRKSPRLQFHTPAPWLSVLPGQKARAPQPFWERSHLTWADLARLEIIRHSTNRDEALSILRLLHDNDPDGLATHRGLKIAIEYHKLDRDTQRILDQYLTTALPDDILKSDILALLTEQDKQTRSPLLVP